MKTNHKRLKTILALEVSKLGPASLAPKLKRILLFDGFLDLANYPLYNYSDLNNFLDFLAYSTLLPQNLSTLLLLSFFSKAILLLLFLLGVGLS